MLRSGHQLPYDVAMSLQIQMKKHSEMVQRAWDEQRSMRRAEREEERRLELEEAKRVAEDTVRARMEAEANERRDGERVREWRNAVLTQIESLRARRAEEAALAEVAAREAANADRVQEVADKRKRMEEKRKKLEDA